VNCPLTFEAAPYLQVSRTWGQGRDNIVGGDRSANTLSVIGFGRPLVNLCSGGPHPSSRTPGLILGHRGVIQRHIAGGVTLTAFISSPPRGLAGDCRSGRVLHLDPIHIEVTAPAQDSPDRPEAGCVGPICAERASELSKALCRAFGGQALVCAHRRPNRLGRTARPSLCELLRTGGEPTKHPLGEGGQRCDAVLYRLIVDTAETIVPLPMHPLRFVRKDIKERQACRPAVLELSAP
jgi:hypothetical protein